MKHFVLLFSILLFGTSAFAANATQNFDFRKLKVAKDLKPGLWSTKFTITPPHPQIKNRVEEVCATQKQLTDALNTAVNNEERPCKIETKSDLTTEANLIMHCPAMDVPQLGVSAPASDIPLKIVKNSMVQWTVTVQMPAVPGVTPKAVWQHVYTRKKDCP